MPSSYVYLGGSLAMQSTVGAGASIVVSLSQNHGLDWVPVTTIHDSGSQSIDLSSLIFRRYDYRVKLELHGDAAIERLRIAEDIQHSQRALPALAQGDNTITLSTGPTEGTVAIEGATNPATPGRNNSVYDFHPTADGLQLNPLGPPGASGALTFPVATPGDLVRIRMGAFFRAVSAGDAWDYRVSFDGGATWSTVLHAAGPTSGDSRYAEWDAVPPGTREALVQYAGTRADTLMLFDFRIDADYREPRGGFAPIRVTYRWDESGAAHEDVHVASSPSETWTIHCGAPPTMKQLVVERAD
jgi:hypothetical protein